jgi:quinol monooxygenase YgiN
VPIIVAGKLIIKTGFREEFIENSLTAISLARKNKACEDFSVSPDPIDANRVNIFEKWESRSALASFRESGPSDNGFSLIESFDVNEYEVST